MTTKKELKTLKEIFATPKPNKLYCGVPDVYFIYHGEWADPEIMYQGKYFNLPMDVEEPLWSYYKEYCEENGFDVIEEDFGEYVETHPDDVYEILNNLIESGIYKENN